MADYISKEKGKKEQSKTANRNRHEKEAVNPFSDHRPETLAQMRFKEMADKKAAKDLVAIQKKAINKTGLPDHLKTGIESLSGYSMDDVKVHYNSSKPAQLNAHAYAQGNQIHLASGQEKHLPHEAWHVVQQKQGRVSPTTQVNGAAVNDSASLEKEADVMGGKALQMKVSDRPLTYKMSTNHCLQQVQLKEEVIQLAGHYLLPGISASELAQIEEKKIGSLSDLMHAEGTTQGNHTFTGWTDVTRATLNRAKEGEDIEGRQDLPPHHYVLLKTLGDWETVGMLSGFAIVEDASWIGRLSHPDGMGLKVSVWDEANPGDSLRQQLENGPVSLEIYYIDGKEV